MDDEKHIPTELVGFDVVVAEKKDPAEEPLAKSFSLTFAVDPARDPSFAEIVIQFGDPPQLRLMDKYNRDRVIALIEGFSPTAEPKPAKKRLPVRLRLRPKVMRADPYAPCPCGSGKKFKFCCR